MCMQRVFLSVVAVVLAVAAPAVAQRLSAAGATASETHSTGSVPNFSRVWTHPAFPWFEPPSSGPGPVTNKSRWPQRPIGASGTLALPPLPLHIVERYRLRDYDDVKDALERNKKENWLLNGDVWSGHRDEKFLQLHVTIEDENVFTTPWTATLTYAPGG
jgi:hypothetical protein